MSARSRFAQGLALAATLTSLLLGAGRAAAASVPPTTGGLCAPLPAPTGTIVTVGPSQASQLPSIVANAASGTTILLQDGTYAGFELAFNTPGVTLRSASGNRDAVIIDGNYTAREITRIYASNITIADLTIKRAYDHLIHLGGGGHNALLYNLHLADGRAQQVKENPDGGNYNDHGTLACSLIEWTDAGRAFHQANLTPGFQCYTGGIDAHQAWGWTVRDNTIKNIYCTNGGLAEHGIHFWTSSRDTVVERNVLINNARGIGFGLGTTGGQRIYPDDPFAGTGVSASQVVHIGGVIRNNFVYADIPQIDVGIGLESAWNASVYHNTVYLTRGGLGLDVRFSTSNPAVVNNLLSPGVILRDGGTTRQNVGTVSASAAMFTDPSSGNLHLASTATQAIDRGASLGGAVPADIDGDPRDSLPDVGADEYVGTSPPPSSLCDLNKDGVTNIVDVQGMVNQAIGVTPCSADINKDGACNIVDVQRVVNAALGGACVSP